MTYRFDHRYNVKQTENQRVEAYDSIITIVDPALSILDFKLCVFVFVEDHI